jgi:hypothetical protein
MMRRIVWLIAVLMVAVAACGGDTAETDSGEPVTTQVDTTQPDRDEGGSDQTTAPTEGTEADDGGGDEGDDSEGSGPSTATVTIGDETYDFSTEGAVAAQCLTDLFGIFSIQLPMIDDGGAQADGSVAIVVLREGTDPEIVGEVNAVEVDVGDETWVADEADDLYEMSDLLEPGMSQVDSVEIEGRTVRGTATFVRQNSLFVGDAAETMTGTFEATCGEERTS